MRFEKKLSNMINLKGISVKDAASILNITPSQLRNWLKGKYDLTQEQEDKYLSKLRKVMYE